MNLQIALGRAASRLQFIGFGVAVGLAASVAFLAVDAHAAETPPAAAPIVPAPIARAAGDGPALWVIRDADSTIYLYGAIHMLKDGTAWGSDKVDAAFDSASNVWFEVTNPDDQSALGPLFQQYAMSPDKPLSSWLTPQEQATLDTAVRAVGMSPAQIDPARPWFAALMIATGPLKAAGFAPENSVELNLRARALAAGKSIHGLETLDQQVGGLARMSDEGQMIYLRSYLSTYATAADQMQRAVAGWSTGDTTAMDRFAFENGRAISEEVHQIFLAKRNADWADQIEGLLKGSGVSFIAVGAAHLAGDDSLQALLAAKGITVTRE
ncbi:TraB/GumN family protein [Brevundimonas nasdae]|uniref:TraB/GumN family protein n=1 Tax=Brevundimonas nasdae TaxID=172043 RepID=A0ABX8TDF0_9CAUL|nr:TraB/GumN family protein [Brevundimonas nasdae]QYC09202.1 TraB/GumN family protein [Brevundimonas nasdae]QYC15251.1 TraB/GumN family protein [Brevundimonas nasdae]